MKIVRRATLVTLAMLLAATFGASSAPQTVQFAAVNAAPVVIAAGDSITWGTNTVDPPGDSWPTLVQQRLGASADVENASIPGGCAFRWDCIGQPVTYRLAHVLRPGVTAVLLTAGGNDLRKGAALSDFQTQYRQLNAALASQGITLWVATIPPWRPALTQFAKFEPPREAVNAWVRRAFSGRVLDFAAALADPQNPSVMYVGWSSNDGLHPNVAGQARLANFVPGGVG